MNRLSVLRAPFLGVLLSFSALTLCADALVHHYLFVNRDREKIRDPGFLETKTFEGAQIKYTWRELEPAKDKYHFSAIQRDLAFLRSNGKSLFIQLQEASFDPRIILVPQYLLDDSAYHGGADKQYEIHADDETNARPAGWVARRWDPAVRARFHKLLAALGHEFDGKIKGINFPETAVEFGETGRLYPKDFTPEIYRDSILTNMLALKRAFPTSVTIQYANFMPGEWLPANDHGYLRTVYQRAQEFGVGVGGPDLLPHRPGQMKHAYPLIRQSAGKIPAAIAVQDGNYEHIDPTTGRRVTIAELLHFATSYLKVDYIFWSTQEPFYSRDLIPFLQSQKRD